MKKRLLSLFLIAVMLLSLCACSGKTKQDTAQPSAAASENTSGGPVRLVYMTSWEDKVDYNNYVACLLYTSPSPRDS